MRDAMAAGTAEGGTLASVLDLANPAFGASFRARFDDGGAYLGPRKLWELCWLAQKFENLQGGRSCPSMLGLGVGVEPLMYHFAHLSEKVTATDLYDESSVWQEARLTADRIRDSSPFAYPQERLTACTMDMRHIDLPEQSVDVVWSCSSVEHVSTLPEFIQIFREVHKVLKPGGVALITTEFSLGEVYLLPGVLSLWRDCALFGAPLEGLTLMGPVDLTYHGAVAGNQPTCRADVRRLTHLENFTERPSGLCINVGYTQFIPVAFALQRTGPRFDWPAFLGAPAWSRPFSSGVEAFQDAKQPGEAAKFFHAALDRAEQPGARLHCYRQLIEACVHAGQVETLHAALHDCAEALNEFPDDDDALDLIGYVAAGQGQIGLAHRCWDRAQRSPSALPGSKLRIRCNQLAAELKAHGNGTEARQLNALADAAWCEAEAFHGPDDPQVVLYSRQLATLREEHGLGSMVSSTGTPSGAVSRSFAASAASARRPDFDMADPRQRPIVYVGGNLALTKTVYGHKMYVDTRSQVGACFLLDGYWEEWIVRYLKDFVKPGMRVFDLGANMGFYTLLLCDLVGPEGHVTAFEPWPGYFDILVRNVQLNGYSPRCTLVNKGVHAAAGKQDLIFYETCGTGALKGAEPYFEGHGIYEKPKTLSIETVSVDGYLAECPQRIDFMKLDVDGSEPFVFQGMSEMLERGDPLAIFCEYSPSILTSMGVDPLEFLETLRAARFAVSEIAPQGIRKVTIDGTLASSDWKELLLVRQTSG